MVSRRAFVGVVTGCLGTMCFFKNRDYIQAVPFKIPQTQSLDQFKEIVRQNKVWSINSYYMTAKSNGVNWYVHVNFYTINMDREPKVGDRIRYYDTHKKQVYIHKVLEKNPRGSWCSLMVG